MNSTRSQPFATGRQLRESARRGEFTSATAGQAPGYVQANLVILPAAEVNVTEKARQ